MAVRHLALALDTAPSSPVDDQLWYDKTNDLLKRWDDGESEWKLVGRGTYLTPAEAEAAYAPVVDEIKLPLLLWTINDARGSTTLIKASHILPAYRFVDSVTGDIICGVPGSIFPDDWTTFAVDLSVANGSGSSGDVSMQFGFNEVAAGGTYTSGTDVKNATTVTVAGLYEKVDATIATLVDVPAATSDYLMRISRLGALAADTLTGASLVTAVTLRKES